MEKTPDVTSVSQNVSNIDSKGDEPSITPARTDVEQGHVGDLKVAAEKGVDKAYAYASAEAIEIDEKTNRYLLRKIDLHVLPWLLGLYILQYLDKGM